jgi:hypothetical protein
LSELSDPEDQPHPRHLIDVTITPVMFVVLFTYLFGGAVAESTSAYLRFILPRILVMSVLFTTVHAGVALNTDLTKGFSTPPVAAMAARTPAGHAARRRSVTSSPGP